MNKLALIAGATAFFSTVATAQTSQPRLSEACRAEVKALCSATGQDREARRACMKENRSKISEGCRAEMKALRGARQATPRPDTPKPEGE